MGERKGAHKFLVGEFEGRNHLKDADLDGRIILKWISIDWMEEHRLGRSVSGQGQAAGPCEYGNEPSGSIKCGEFFE
jgi:hypothetical protein